MRNVGMELYIYFLSAENNVYGISFSSSYPEVALAILVADQLTGFFVWFQNGSKFSIPCHVEAVISGQHQQTSAVSPTDILLHG